MVKERERKRKEPPGVKSPKAPFVPEKTKPAHLSILILTRDGSVKGACRVCICGGLHCAGFVLRATAVEAEDLCHRSNSVYPLALLVSAGHRLGGYPLRDGDEIRWALVFQIGLWAVVGIGLLALAISDLQRWRNAQSMLLFLWIAGTFIFASFVNWTVNGRSILPMAPAIGILVARRIEHRFGSLEAGPLKILWPLIPAALLALLVSWADFRLAGSARSIAAEIHEKYGSDPARLWFQGHWGFQHYMEARGSRAFDRQESRIVPGDFMVVPKNSTGTMR